MRMRDELPLESRVLSCATAPPKLWPVRVMGVIGLVVCPVYFTMVIRDPDNHEKPLELFGIAIAFLFSAMPHVIKPHHRG